MKKQPDAYVAKFCRKQYEPTQICEIIPTRTEYEYFTDKDELDYFVESYDGDDLVAVGTAHYNTVGKLVPNVRSFRLVKNDWDE